MKKLIIGLAASVALFAAPASAGYFDASQSAWDIIDASGETGRNLFLIANLADDLDVCGNGAPYYTVFLPVDEALLALLDTLDMTIAKLAATPSVVTALLNDHIARGSFSYDELLNPSVTRIMTRSGYVLTKSLIDGSVYVDSKLIVESVQTCNGHVHFITDVIDSTNQVPTTGVGSDTTTPAPVTTESELPNTL